MPLSPVMYGYSSVIAMAIVAMAAISRRKTDRPVVDHRNGSTLKAFDGLKRAASHRSGDTVRKAVSRCANITTQNLIDID